MKLIKNYIYYLYTTFLIKKLLKRGQPKGFNLEKILYAQSEKYVCDISLFEIERHLHRPLKKLFNINKLYFLTDQTFDKHIDFALLWGYSSIRHHFKMIHKILKMRSPFIILEDGFIRSIETWANKKADLRWQLGCAYVADDKGIYYDAKRPSRLEDLLNSNEQIMPNDLSYAQKIIKTIKTTHVSKYNHAPIFTPEFANVETKKILILDQSFGDQSIAGALANRKNFQKMLRAAVAENPNADILIKTHPDTITGTRRGYFSGIKKRGRIIPITYNINPISLLKSIDKVYTVSSQMGFEALLCGKTVVCFGAPFYAGWGVTDDRITIPRRTRTRSVEEIFYFTYIRYTHYCIPSTQERCSIEDAINYLLREREEYFKIYKIKNELDSNV